MSKSEQIRQDELYSKNITILDKYECISLGATTINQLMNSGIIKKQSLSKNLIGPTSRFRTS